MKVHSMNGGEPCEGDMKATKGCTPPVKDCVVSPWSEWQECDKTCGGGQQRRIRQIQDPPSLGGKECPRIFRETQPCNENPCHPRQDCKLSLWTKWGTCTVTCGTGQQVRKRTVTQEATAD